MNTNIINICSAEKRVKQLSVELKDNYTARMRFRLNSCGNPLSMECYVYNRYNNLVNGIGIGRSCKLKLSEVIDFLSKVNKVSENGDVFEKFSETISH